MRLRTVRNVEEGITCVLCEAVNDGGKRLSHAERAGDIPIIRTMDFCDECLDGLVRTTLAQADPTDIAIWMEMLLDLQREQFRQQYPDGL